MLTYSDSPWQPIDTAPRDQRAILAVNERSGKMYVCWRAETIFAETPDLPSVNEFYLPFADYTWKPTHWMPLPKPPKGSGPCP